MPDVDPAAQAAALQSLSNAYLAADKAYVAANDANPAAPQLPDLMAARNQALLAYVTATKQSLASNSAATQQIKQQLDAATADINSKLATLKDAAQWLQLVGSMVKLASSLASAFA